jgi:DNA-binding protein Fis
LEDAEKRLVELEADKAKALREQKMEKVLSSLNGKKREQMAFVLQNVETHKLEEAYKFFIGRVLKEEVVEPTKETITEETAAVVAESTVLVTGEQPLVEEVQSETKTKQTAALDNLRRLAGIR